MTGPPPIARFEDLQDVSFGTPSNGWIAAWNSSTQKMTMQAPPSSATLTLLEVLNAGNDATGVAINLDTFSGLQANGSGDVTATGAWDFSGNPITVSSISGTAAGITSHGTLGQVWQQTSVTPTPTQAFASTVNSIASANGVSATYSAGVATVALGAITPTTVGATGVVSSPRFLADAVSDPGSGYAFASPGFGVDTSGDIVCNNIASHGTISLGAYTSGTQPAAAAGKLFYQSDTQSIEACVDGTNWESLASAAYVANFLPLSGGDITGAIDMGGSPIINVSEIQVNGALADGTYPCGSGSITITNGVISSIS